MPQIRKKISNLLPWLTELRRNFHRCPEPMYQEKRTSALAHTVLTQAGYDAKTGFGITGLAALWDSCKPGPTLAFRADIDALNISEPPSSPFISEHPGFMHACGHDFNLALLLGLARLAAEDALSIAGGRLMFICQPAEEGGGGSEAMLKDGLFETVARPDFIFAAHAAPHFSPGCFIINPGPTMAGKLDFKITCTGRGGHAGTPDSANNPLPWLAGLIGDISRLTPTEEALITVTMMQAGERTNVIPPNGFIAGTLRWYSQSAKENILKFVTARCAEAEARGGVTIEQQWEEGYRPTINNPQVASRVRKVAEDFFRPGLVSAEKPSLAGEDFSVFLEQIPGAYFYFGTGGPGYDAPLHSPYFKINEDTLPLGLEFWARLAENASSWAPLQ